MPMLSVSALRVKRTSLIHAPMSTHDPKRTFWRCFGEEGNFAQLLRALAMLSALSLQ